MLRAENLSNTTNSVAKIEIEIDMRKLIIPPYAMDDIKKMKKDMPKDKRGSRLKIPRDTGALVRFIPTQMGPDKTWFLKHANHWIDQKAFACPRESSLAAGGLGDNASCPICDVVHDVNDTHSDAAIRNKAYKSFANPQWLTWVVVYTTYNEKEHGTDNTIEEQTTPLMFDLFQNAHSQVLSHFERSMKRRNPNPHGIFDLDKGTTFYVTNKKGKGMQITGDTNGDPIFDINNKEAYERAIEKMYAHIKVPDSFFKVESLEVLEEEAYKLEERLMREGGGSKTQKKPLEESPEDAAPMEEESPAGRSRRPIAETESTPSRSSRRRGQTEGGASADYQAESSEPDKEEEQDEVPMGDVSTRRPRSSRSEQPESTSSRQPQSSVASESIDSEEIIPEESKDAAPVRQLEDDLPPVNADAPEPESTKRASSSGRLSSKLNDRLKARQR